MLPTLLLTLLGLPYVSACDEGWTPFEKNCYKTFSEPGIQNAHANDFCMKHGATLASVLTDSERKFLVDFATTGECIKNEQQMLIGAYRESQFHPWKWYDGSPFTQMNFFTYPGEPTNNAGEFYMALMGDRYSDGKPFGSFIDVPLGQAHFFVCKKNDTQKNTIKCDDRWVSFGSNCYRRLSDTSGNECKSANRVCNNHGAILASVLSEEERKFVVDYLKRGRQLWDRYQTFIGGFRSSVNSPWQWFDGTPFTQHDMWLKEIAPSNVATSVCMKIKADPPASDSWSGLGPHGYFFDVGHYHNHYQLLCKKKGVLVCDAESMIAEDGKCVCKPDFIDIVDTGVPEANNYIKGQKCVRKGKCYSVKDSTSILFIIDSSESITAAHWPKMVEFVKGGAKKLPNSFRVGFVKFSTAVSDSKWLKPNWTEEQYYNAVPSKYDRGETNTPLALKHAKDMFKKDNNKNKIAVLITDGMPFAPEEYEEEKDAIIATKKATQSLIKDGIRLTMMGVGPDVFKGSKDVKEWLRNPKKDYLSFVDTVDCLKGSDMDNLLQIVCDS